MDEESTKRYLDDLLVKLEVFGEDEDIREKLSDELIRTVNYYKDDYPSIMKEYGVKVNEILEKYKK